MMMRSVFVGLETKAVIEESGSRSNLTRSEEHWNVILFPMCDIHMAPSIYLHKVRKWYAGGDIIHKYILNYRSVAFMCTWIWMVSYIRYNAPIHERKLIYILMQMTSVLIQRESCCLLFFSMWKRDDFLKLFPVINSIYCKLVVQNLQYISQWMDIISINREAFWR
jgi:hypothetical protein